MTLVVLDASAGVRSATKGKNWDLVRRVTTQAQVVYAPGWYGIEVANALWKLVAHGDLRAVEAMGRLEIALDLVGIQVEPSADLIHEALQDAVRLGHPVYDLLYVVIARRLGAALLTADRRLAAVAEKSGVEVELV